MLSSAPVLVHSVCKVIEKVVEVPEVQIQEQVVELPVSLMQEKIVEVNSDNFMHSSTLVPSRIASNTL